jgi:uncharacterized protein involved in exopolysaccharide biosynthesis
MKPAMSSNDNRGQKRSRSSSRHSSGMSRRRRKEKLDARALLDLLRRHKTLSLMVAAAITVLAAAWMAIELAT